MSVPKFLSEGELIWLRCNKTQELSEMETGCLIEDARGNIRLVIVEPRYCKLAENLLRAVKVGTTCADETNWLVDVPSGERLLVLDEKVTDGSSI